MTHTVLVQSFYHCQLGSRLSEERGPHSLLASRRLGRFGVQIQQGTQGLETNIVVDLNR
jgi:hypothetical protein